MSLKRSFEHFLGEQPKVQIKLVSEHQQGEPLAPHLQVVQLFSLCAAGLPTQAADQNKVWDLSNILIDGQPVGREAVVAWLNACYRMVYKADFEAQPQQNSNDLVHSFEGLYRLLAFADAVDSTRGLLESCVPQLGGLQLHAHLGQQQLSLCPDDGDWIMNNCQLSIYRPGSTNGVTIGVAANQQEGQAFLQQVAAQTEQLLWLAYKLQLEPLVQQLHDFIRSASLFDYSVLRQQLGSVFSSRVLEALSISGLNLGRQAWINSVLTQEVAFTEHAAAGVVLLEPLYLTAAQRKPLEFFAKLRADVLGIPSGTTVRVQLDLFEQSRMCINDDIHIVQLGIGYRCRKK